MTIPCYITFPPENNHRYGNFKSTKGIAFTKALRSGGGQDQQMAGCGEFLEDRCLT